VRRSERVRQAIGQEVWTLQHGLAELVSERTEHNVTVSVFRCAWLARPYLWYVERYDRTGGVSQEIWLPEPEGFATAEACAADAWALVNRPD
jgi:hypothetical protein